MEAAPHLLTSPSTLNSTNVHSSGNSAAPFEHVYAHAGFHLATVRQSLVFLSFGHHIVLSRSWRLAWRGDKTDYRYAAAGRETPTTITSQFAGTAQAFQSSLATEPFLVLAAIVAIYLVLGILYESLIHPITILTTLPSASVGAMFALILFKSELDVISLIGILLLIGIVKKNAILMIDFALQAERLEGKSTEDSIFEACLLRFRPILMTTLAALFGAMPLAFGHGVGSELRRPLGIAIVGGLIFSQALTLYTTPIIYLYFDRISQWFKHRRSKSTELTTGATTA